MVYIYIPTIWLIFMVNVGKYTSPTDPMRFEPTKHRFVMTYTENSPNWLQVALVRHRLT